MRDLPPVPPTGTGGCLPYAYCLEHVMPCASLIVSFDWSVINVVSTPFPRSTR